MLERGEVNIGTSIGIATIPHDGTTLNDLQRNADLALYRAKEEGRGRFKFFEPGMSVAAQSKMAMARDLRRAVSENTGLAVHYQPQVSLSTGRVIGYEALIRWTHPTLGNIPPAEFIPVAENSQLICDIGLWIMREAAVAGESLARRRRNAARNRGQRIGRADLAHRFRRRRAWRCWKKPACRRICCAWSSRKAFSPIMRKDGSAAC